MLKQFPMKLFINSLIAVILFFGGGYWFIFPMCKKSDRYVTGIRYYYSGVDSEIRSRLEKERVALMSLERKLSPLTESGEKNTKYFDFLQETIGKRGIQTSKITNGERITQNSVQQEDFMVSFTGKYHTIGMIISDLENGPFYCSVKSLHLFSKSLLDNTLEVDLEFSFCRMAE